MTLRHIVLMKMSATNPDERRERTETLASALRELPPHIEQILALSVGMNVLERTGNWDLALTVDVADEDALEVYRNHPEHLKVLHLINDTVAERAAADYFV